MLWVELKPGKFNILCGACYRQPVNCVEDTARFLDCLQTSIDSIRQRPKDLTVLMGDYNALYNQNNASNRAPFGSRFFKWLA